MSDEKAYREDLGINRFALDKEWEEQPEKFINWYEKEIEAQFQRDKLKEQLDLTKAELDGEIRETAASNSVKITEAMVSSEILKSERFKKINNDYLESVKNAKILGAAREAFEHRKKALEKLTDLFIAGYWSTPCIKVEARTAVERSSSDGARDALQKSMMNRRK
jgi:hypothetical protein